MIYASIPRIRACTAAAYYKNIGYNSTWNIKLRRPIFFCKRIYFIFSIFHYIYSRNFNRIANYYNARSARAAVRITAAARAAAAARTRARLTG